MHSSCLFVFVWIFSIRCRILKGYRYFDIFIDYWFTYLAEGCRQHIIHLYMYVYGDICLCYYPFSQQVTEVWGFTVVFLITGTDGWVKFVIIWYTRYSELQELWGWASYGSCLFYEIILSLWPLVQSRGSYWFALVLKCY